jgi:hypothetical protein
MTTRHRNDWCYLVAWDRPGHGLRGDLTPSMITATAAATRMVTVASQTAPRRWRWMAASSCSSSGTRSSPRHLFCQHAGHCDQVSQDRRHRRQRARRSCPGFGRPAQADLGHHDWVNQIGPSATAPQVDTSVHQSR